MEIPLTYIMSLAWNIHCTSAAKVPQFYQAFAEREFGYELGHEIGDLLLGHDRLVALRRHEHIEPDTFSIINYSEDYYVERWWLNLEERGTKICNLVPECAKPAFFQLVLHPIRVFNLHSTPHRTSQEQFIRVTTPKYHKQDGPKGTLLFDEDLRLSEDYHSMLGGKWNHIMRQPHYGYGDTWHAPSRDLITGLSFVHTRQDSNPIVGNLGIWVEGHEGVRPGPPTKNRIAHTLQEETCSLATFSHPWMYGDLN
jgi:hypothetical protein